MIQDKKEEEAQLSPIEKQFLEQIIDSNNDTKSDEETEVESSDDDDESDTVSSSNVKIHSINESCKIIVCDDGSAQDDANTDALVSEYLEKHGFQLDSRDLEKYTRSGNFLCAYCEPELKSNNQNEDILVHITSTHKAFPILAYTLSNNYRSPINYDFDNLGDDIAEMIVANFRQQLGNG